MRKTLLLLVAMSLISVMHAEIKPVSQGSYKTEYVGGITDQYVKMLYAQDGTYYAFSLKCASKFNPLTFSLVLGHSPEEALRSVDVMHAAGHSDLSMTTRYADHIDDGLIARINDKAGAY